jgi:hypothetical protein
MDPRDIILAAIGTAHGFARQIFADVPQEALTRKVEGSTINPIAPIYLHLAITEDWFVNSIALGGQPKYATGGWGEKLGVELKIPPVQDPAWASTVQLDHAQLASYADAVFASTEAAIRAMTDEQLAREFEFGPLGKLTVARFLAGVTTYHVSEHAGEIAALKGVAGLKGLPF